jgi:signal transduction histidine kinase
MYQSLDPTRIIQTLERLKARIDARFPNAGLGHVAVETVDTAIRTAAHAAALAAPSWSWRMAVGALIALGVAAQVAAARFLHLDQIETNLGLLQSLEAAVNLLILFGGAAWFLLTLEERMKRQRALDALHELRSLAHVIDMHQLTKDPTNLLNANRTAASPERIMTRFELTRYLDYCAEMLALIGKLAALYAERMRDNVVIEAVNDIENLTTDLSRKIWQKIMIIGDLEEGSPSAAPPPLEGRG